MRVKDLRVLITGAASGAGRTIAEMLADADARVFVSDISGVSVADLSNARPDIRVVQADAGNEAEIDDMFTQAERHLGGLDVRTMVTAEDVASMALFLASDASCRVSGQMIAVDGHLQYEV